MRRTPCPSSTTATTRSVFVRIFVPGKFQSFFLAFAVLCCTVYLGTPISASQASDPSVEIPLIPSAVISPLTPDNDSAAVDGSFNETVPLIEVVRTTSVTPAPPPFEGCPYGVEPQNREGVLVCPATYFSFKKSVLANYVTGNDWNIPILIGVAAILTSLPFWGSAVHQIFGFPAEHGWIGVLSRLSGDVSFRWLGLTYTIAMPLVVTLVEYFDGKAQPACAADVGVYQQMFCEPTRHQHAFVRHPANSWSNIPYLLMGLYLIVATVSGRRNSGSSGMWRTDFCFGVMLSSLFCWSFLWHGTNCPWVHYYDVANMYSVILFFPVRYLTLAFQGWFSKPNKPKDFDRFAAALYAMVVVALFSVSRSNHSRDIWATKFPTARNRTDLFFGEVLAFMLMPMFYWVSPLLCLFGNRRCGNVPCSALAAVVLVLAWVFHLAERWALDVFCVPHSWIQPTGTFHALTAVTIFFGHCHLRSMEVGPTKKPQLGQSQASKPQPRRQRQKLN